MKPASNIKVIINLMAVVDFVLSMEWIFKGISRVLSSLTKIMRLSCRAGQSSRIWDKSQMHSFRWRVQNGESLRPSLKEWLGRRWCPMRSLLNCTIYGLCKCRLLNQVFLRIFGVIFLYLEANSAGRLFQRENQILVEYSFIRGVKSEWGSW